MSQRAVRRHSASSRELAVMAVHDLRSPITELLLLVEALDGEDPAVRRVLEPMVAALDRLRELTTAVLECSRSEGRLEPTFVDVDLDTMLHASRRAARQRAAVRAVDIVIDAAAPLWLTADAGLIRRLIDNLLDNAIKYAPSSSTVTLSARVDARGVVLTVADEGAGIPLAARSAIFEPYRRGPGHSADGFGLGLAFCRLVAEAHGGSIELDDRSGGCAFVVCLPGVPVEETDAVPDLVGRAAGEEVTAVRKRPG